MLRTWAAIGIAGAALAAVAAGQTREAKPRPLLIGIVDLGVVYAKYDRTADVLREVNREKESFEARLDEQRRNVERIRKELGGVPEGEARRAKLSELEVAERTFESIRVDGAMIGHRFEMQTLKVIDEIERGVRDFARRHHYDVIMKTTTKGWGETGLPERIYRAQISTVVAYDPSLDVTEPIVTHLNSTPTNKGERFH